ncbi:hypothetical protein KI387_042038, partial [Taxus chinensis]
GARPRLNFENEDERRAYRREYQRQYRRRRQQEMTDAQREEQRKLRNDNDRQRFAERRAELTNEELDAERRQHANNMTIIRERSSQDDSHVSRARLQRQIRSGQLQEEERLHRQELHREASQRNYRRMAGNVEANSGEENSTSMDCVLETPENLAQDIMNIDVVNNLENDSVQQETTLQPIRTTS